MKRHLLLAVLLVSLTVIAFSLGRSIGHSAAVAEADAHRDYINRKMDEMGFCAWVLDSFVEHCRASHSARAPP